ncbi:DUF3667 domain-containing protein [Poritiphilus flavus]|uniref:DUF3667 domain-containing protein n=1 Tax=Poritiphilus flavus TaxID=2697053 RepID=A0A6L9E8R3_9FLAO|nr:DUF3667 domain-containing protein [Poritiphilus flavus]NAS11110.1 DUF3667 domain-containing protein [Poritiphilus flavus]
MACKNCGTDLRTDYNYCPVCGAKVIRNRLSLKNLWYDVTERYFNMDNTFLMTFKHMFTKPQEVIGCYVAGIRRKYLNPVSYLGIALTVSGLSLFLMRKVFWDDIFTGDMGNALNPEVAEKIMTVSLDFSSFVFLLYIPILGFLGWILFNKRNYNFTEFLVVGIYSLAHYSLASFPFTILVMIFAPTMYLESSYVFILLMALLAVYILNRLNGRLSIGRSLLFLFLFGIGFFMMGMLINLVLIVTGVLSFSDYLPK